MSDDDFERGGLKFKSTFRTSIDFKEWRKTPISRKGALRTAWRAFRERNYIYAWQMTKAAVRGYTTGVLYNPGA